MRSMTGFGLGTQALDEGKLTVEVRGVNHRFTDVRVRVPREVEALALFMEQLARARFSRGRFDVSVRLDGHLVSGGGQNEVVLDRARARAAYQALASFRDEVAPGTEVPLSLLASVPGLFVAEAGGRFPLEPVRRALEAAFDQAATAFDAMRDVEGASLGKDLRARLEAIRRALGGIEARLPALLDAHRARLRERLERLEYSTSPAAAGLNEGRVERELSLLADRADVTEELTRLSSHAAQIEQAIGGLPSPEAPESPARDKQVGRRIDFLLQEMAREANTLSAKSSDAEVAQAVVFAKVEIERMREQVQNVE